MTATESARRPRPAVLLHGAQLGPGAVSNQGRKFLQGGGLRCDLAFTGWG